MGNGKNDEETGEWGDGEMWGSAFAEATVDMVRRCGNWGVV